MDRPAGGVQAQPDFTAAFTAGTVRPSAGILYSFATGELIHQGWPGRVNHVPRLWPLMCGSGHAYARQQGRRRRGPAPGGGCHMARSCADTVPNFAGYARRRFPIRRSRSLTPLVIVIVLGLVASCSAGTSPKRTPLPASFPEVAQTVGPSGMKVRFPGGWVDVPSGAVARDSVDPTCGAVARERTLHVRTAAPLPSAPAAKLMHALTAGVTVDLTGQQPQRPLTVALPVPSALPAGVRPQALFVAAAEGPGTAPRLLAARYDSADHLLIAQASHLSSFYPVWLDAPATVQGSATTRIGRAHV